MSFNRKDAKFTYGDYLNWQEGERWELIDGVAYNMSPAPSVQHQRISMELSKQIAVYLTGKECLVFAAPFDVRLPKGNERDEDIDTVVQPDIVVVCDRGKLDERGCKGAPDVVVEITSPSTARKDAFEKFLLYERAGVGEYWIVRPEEKIVMVFRMGEDGRFGRMEMYDEMGKVRIGIFEDLEVDLGAVFGE